jgi:hypothetical protein
MILLFIDKKVVGVLFPGYSSFLIVVLSLLMCRIKPFHVFNNRLVATSVAAVVVVV